MAAMGAQTSADGSGAAAAAAAVGGGVGRASWAQPAPLAFDIREIERFRYRVEDTLKKVRRGGFVNCGGGVGEGIWVVMVVVGCELRGAVQQSSDKEKGFLAACLLVEGEERGFRDWGVGSDGRRGL